MQSMRYVQQQPPPPPHPSLLPIFPGNNWDDATKVFHKKKNVLDEIPLKMHSAPPKELPHLNETTKRLLDSLSNPVPHDEEFKPQRLTLEDKVLRYLAWFSETLEQGMSEARIIRKVIISYFPVDGTLTVVEPRVTNSGIIEGVLIKRQKIYRWPEVKNEGEKYININDLNVGKDVVLYQKEFHIVDADTATRSFLNELNVPVPDGMDYPEDPFLEARISMDTVAGRHPRSEADLDLKRTFEHSVKSRAALRFPNENRRTQQFLASDGTVLSFKAIWDDRSSPHGDIRYFEIRYYLCDDTVEVMEKLPANCGRDPMRAFVRRCRLPKDPSVMKETYNLTFFSRVNGGIPEDKNYLYYAPQDFYIGAKVDLFGRMLLLVDCDAFTREFYSTNLGMELSGPIPADQIAPPSRKKSTRENVVVPPPHNGFGTEEDSLENWKHLVLRAPKMDLKKWMTYSDKVLRFKLRFHEPSSPEHVVREFLLSFFLGDDTLQITEQFTRNTGFVGGKFLARQKVKKYQGEGPLCFYQWNDFYKGALVTIFAHRFMVMDMDEFTRQFRYKRENLPTYATSEGFLSMVQPMQLEQDVACLSIQDFLQEVGTRNPDFATTGEGSTLLQILKQFNLDYNGDRTVGDFLRVLSGQVSSPVTTKATTTPPTATQQLELETPKRRFDCMTPQTIAVLKLLKEAIQAQGLEPADAFRVISAQPHSRSSVGLGISNAIDRKVNPYQVTTACREAFGLRLSEAEMAALNQVFFPDDDPKKWISLMTFITILQGADGK